MKTNNTNYNIGFCLLLVFGILTFNSQDIQAQCSTNYVEVCNAGGTFSNWTNMDIIGSCLDPVISNDGAYVVFNVQLGGELNVSISGSPAVNAFMDVAVYSIPSGSDPCTAPVQISCNFATNNSDCASFGGGLGCISDISPGPTVNTGDRVMILAHDYNNAYSSFTVSVGVGAGKAVLGPPLIDLQATGPFLNTDTPAAINTGANHGGGGVYSASCGGCINSSTGVFDPGAAGLGTHTVTYTHYSVGNPCYNTASINVTVNPANNPPSITSGSTANFTENTTGVVLDVESTDDSDSEGSGLTYSIVAGNDGSSFNIDSDDGELRFVNPPDFEDPQDGNGDNDYVVEIQVCDSQNACTTQTITVTVTNVVEAVLGLALTANPNACQGGVAAYSLTVENNSGEDDAIGITLSDVLPSGFTFYADTIELINGATQASPTPQPVIGDAGTITWGTFDIPDGASVVISYNTLVDVSVSDGSYSNNITGTVATYSPVSVVENITVGGVNCTNPPPFVCEPAFYQVYKMPGQPSQFAKLNPADGSYTNLAILGAPVNGMGFDANTGFVYGAIKNRFVRMDGNGTILDMGIGFANNCFSGDMDENGFWYGKVGADMVKVDVNGPSPVLAATYAGQSLPGADMSYNIDGHFYAASGQTIYKFDTGTNTKSTIGTVTGATLPGGAYGAQWTGSDGYLYISSNTTGEIFRISIDNLDAKLVMNATANLKGNDGFSCPTELPAPFGYDYSDKSGAGQARNLVHAQDATMDDIPDFDAVWLGAKVDIDATDPSNITATGDTNDDGLTTPTNAPAGQTADFDIHLNTNISNVIAHYGLYLDWDNDGTFEDFYNGSSTISTATTITVAANVPSTYTGGTAVARARVGEVALIAGNAAGDLDIGETEDHAFIPNASPVITAANTANFQENGTGAVLDVVSTDDNDSEGSGLTYSFTGNGTNSPDEGDFNINTSTGEITFNPSPDYESPADDDANNVYQIEIQVCDSGSLCTAQIITITVTDEDEDGDGFTGVGDPDDADPCVPQNSVSNCCEAVAPAVTKE